MYSYSYYNLFFIYLLSQSCNDIFFFQALQDNSKEVEREYTTKEESILNVMKVENMDQKEIQTVKEENDEEDLEYSLDEHVSPKEVKHEDL